MGISVTGAGSSGILPEPEEIRRELSRVLASRVFRGSKRCQDFLRYVVTKILEGEGGSLKERTLAIEVFGRDVSDSPSDDSIVRVGAREVRKRLAQYYVQDGADDDVRIELPPGSYVAVFHYHEKHSPLVSESLPPAPPLELAPVDDEAVRRPVAIPKFWPWTALILAAGAALAIWIWRGGGWRANEFETFWKPVFGNRNRVEILLANPIVYHPSSRATQLDHDLNSDGGSPLQRPIRVPPRMLDGSDFVPANGEYTALADAMAALRLNNLLLQHHTAARVRSAIRAEFNDLAGAGVLLTGAFTNRWTVELTKHNRFQFAYTGPKPSLVDTATGRRWILNGKADNGQSAEDYILLCRLPHAPTNGFVVIGAGINFYGTDEAGKILSEPESLNPILKKLPAGWAERNLEVVLHVEVIGEAPALPEVVAAHTW